jgi:hypothetical protein
MKGQDVSLFIADADDLGKWSRLMAAPARNASRQSRPVLALTIGPGMPPLHSRRKRHTWKLIDIQIALVQLAAPDAP